MAIIRDSAASADPVVTVCLQAGTHDVPTAGLVMDERDSGVAYVALDSHRGATVVSGGTAVTGWVAAGDGSGLWRAPLSAALAPGRNLWVNGVRYNRTRVSGASLGLEPNDSGYATHATPDWSQPAAVEMVWPSQVKNWIAPRCTVARVVANSTGAHVTLLPGCWQALVARNGGPAPTPSIVENIGKPTQPGEFFADFTSGALWVYPLPGVNMSAPTTAVVVGTKTSVLSGTNVKTHTWSGVTFAYSTWDGVGVGDGYVPAQTAVYACPRQSGGTTDCEPVGAVHFTASHNLEFSSCSFVHQGALYALSVGGASSQVSITGSAFSDLSGGAVKLGNVNDTRAVATDPDEWDANMMMQGCTVSDSSLEYFGAAAVFAGYVASTTLDHNTIGNTGYTGVSLGWGWGRVVSFARNNHVTNNYVHDVMRSLVDGGCIYTLGAQPGSTVSGNYVDADLHQFGVLYHDNGSRYFNTTRNVVDNSPNAHAFFLQGCCNAPAADIYVADIWIRNSDAYLNNCAAEGCVVDTSTIVQVGASEPWPPGAQSIIDAAGSPARLLRR